MHRLSSRIRVLHRCTLLQSDAIFSFEEIPDIPSDLAGIWSYIMWEDAGCPNRSQEAADHEYREAIEQLKNCLSRGKTLNELWQVCSRKSLCVLLLCSFLHDLQQRR